ncbi:hypothetical protein LINPERHAP1_LOCUS12989 [Linum perenne]
MWRCKQILPLSSSFFLRMFPVTTNMLPLSEDSNALLGQIGVYR